MRKMITILVLAPLAAILQLAQDLAEQEVGFA